MFAVRFIFLWLALSVSPLTRPHATPLCRLAKRFRLQSRLFRSFRVPFFTLLSFVLLVGSLDPFLHGSLLLGSLAPCSILADWEKCSMAA